MVCGSEPLITSTDAVGDANDIPEENSIPASITASAAGSKFMFLANS